MGQKLYQREFDKSTRNKKNRFKLGVRVSEEGFLKASSRILRYYKSALSTSMRMRKEISDLIQKKVKADSKLEVIKTKRFKSKSVEDLRYLNKLAQVRSEKAIKACDQKIRAIGTRINFLKSDASFEFLEKAFLNEEHIKKHLKLGKKLKANTFKNFESLKKEMLFWEKTLVPKLKEFKNDLKEFEHKTKFYEKRLPLVDILKRNEKLVKYLKQDEWINYQKIKQKEAFIQELRSTIVEQESQYNEGIEL